jgi:hypothetical protein
MAEYANVSVIRSSSKDGSIGTVSLDVAVLFSAEISIPTFAITGVQSFGVGSGVLLCTDAYDSSTNGSIYVTLTGVCERIPTRCVFVGKWKSSSSCVHSWRKGSYLTGWLNKWPMKSQTLGRMKKRFFVLVDDELTYYKRVPEASSYHPRPEVFSIASGCTSSHNNSSYRSNSSGGGERRDSGDSDGIGEDGDQRSPRDPQDPNKTSLRICEQTSIKVGTHFKYRCLSLKTPTNILWFTGENADVESVWMNEINTVVNHLGHRQALRKCLTEDYSWTNSTSISRDEATAGSTSTASSSSSSSTGSVDHPTKIDEVLWFNDPPGYNLVAVDAVERELVKTSSEITEPDGARSGDYVVTAAIFGKTGDYYLEATLASEQKIVARKVSNFIVVSCRRVRG